MSSSISSSDPPSDSAVWRRFFRLAVGTAALGAALLYLFIVSVDPYDVLPFSPPWTRPPVDSNERWSFPALARSGAFDSAIFGTSSSRLLRPVTLNPEFGAHFANLSMNAATAYEQTRLMQVFARHHPRPRVLMLGLDVQWCLTAERITKYRNQPIPEWMYDEPWLRGYREMFNLNVLEKAGQGFAVFTGLQREHYGRDGYTSFVPDDRLYDPARAATHLNAAVMPIMPETGVDPRILNMPALATLPQVLGLFPTETRKILFFVPYNHVLQPQHGAGRAWWDECKRRVTQVIAATPNAIGVDFMILSPITQVDTNYWDALHYRIGIADRLAHDLAAANRGASSEDYRLLRPGDSVTAESR